MFGVQASGCVDGPKLTLTSLELSPADVGLRFGGGVITIQDYVTTAHYSNGSQAILDNTTVGWTTGAPAIAGILSPGRAITVDLGQTTITATYQGLTATATIRVIDP